jgi:hypothetical protein
MMYEMFGNYGFGTGKEVRDWLGLLETVMDIPGARIDRNLFLRREFRKYYNSEILAGIPGAGPGQAGVPEDIMNKAAAKTIACHTLSVTSLSFASGLPGGLFMLGTIPFDIVQYYYHLAVIAQKIAYIYGWPEPDQSGPDGFFPMLTVFIGIMTGIISDNDEMISPAYISETDPPQITCFIFSKIGIPVLAKQAAKRLGLKILRHGGTRLAAKAVPLAGGFASGAMTLVTFLPMANRLKNMLRKATIRY